MKPNKIFLDTSILPRNLILQGQGIIELVDLVKAGIVEVHLSRVSMREWISQMELEFEQRVLRLDKAISDLERFATPEMIGQGVVGAFEDIAALKNDVRLRAERRVQGFLKSIDAKIIPVDPVSAAQVIEDYFDGRPPFKQAKSRTDFPDAFILTSLVSLANRGKVFAGIADKELSKAASGLESVKVFSNLKELTGNFRPELEEVQQFQELIGLLRNNQSTLIERIGPLLQKLFDNTEVQDSSIPSDNGDAMVIGYGEFEEIEFDWENAYDYGGGWISVPISFQAELMLHFFVYRGDAFSVPNWVSVDIGDFEVDHSFEAEGDRTFDCTANLSLKFTEPEIRHLRLPKDIEVDELEVSMANEGDGGEY